MAESLRYLPAHRAFTLDILWNSASGSSLHLSMLTRGEEIQGPKKRTTVIPHFWMTNIPRIEGLFDCQVAGAFGGVSQTTRAAAGPRVLGEKVSENHLGPARASWPKGRTSPPG